MSVAPPVGACQGRPLTGWGSPSQLEMDATHGRHACIYINYRHDTDTCAELTVCSLFLIMSH